MEQEEKKTGREKANLDVEIKLPNVEKPFFAKKSTESNLVKQLTKASTKLDQYQTLDLWINGNKNIVLTKADIQDPNLKTNILERISVLNALEKSEKSAKEMGVDFSYKSDDKNIKTYNLKGNPQTAEKDFISEITNHAVSYHKNMSDKWANELSNRTALSKGLSYDNIDENQAHHWRKYEQASKELNLQNKSILNTQEEKSVVGRITFHDSGEIVSYKSDQKYLDAIKHEMYHNPNGFTTETVKREPELLKKVDDIYYDEAGIDNPNNLNHYVEKVQKENAPQQNVDPDRNPLYDRDGNDFTDALIDSVTTTKKFDDSLTSEAKDIINVGEKSETSESFTIDKDDFYDVVVHLEKDDLNVINSIIDKLNQFKEQGFNYISTEHADYQVNTYTDAEHYYNDGKENDVFYLAKEDKEISNTLDKSTSVSNSNTNSEDNIETGRNYQQMSINFLLDKFENKKIFLPREMTNFGIEPSDLKRFSANIETAVNVQSINPNLEKNLAYLKDQIKFAGFGESPELHKELKDKLNSNAQSFTIDIKSDKASFKNEINFTLHFNKAQDTNTAFFNKFTGNLKNDAKELDRTHTFTVKKDGITAKQAVNLLEGRAVKTSITNTISKQKEDAFIKLKFDEKNDKGNYKLQVFNKNYGVDTSKIVDKSNLFFQDAKHRDITIKSLEKGNIVNVKMKDGEKVVDGKAVLNPASKTVNLYDTNMRRQNTNAPVIKEQQEQTVKQQQSHSRKL